MLHFLVGWETAVHKSFAIVTGVHKTVWITNQNRLKSLSFICQNYDKKIVSFSGAWCISEVFLVSGLRTFACEND